MLSFSTIECELLNVCLAGVSTHVLYVHPCSNSFNQEETSGPSAQDRDYARSSFFLSFLGFEDLT